MKCNFCDSEMEFKVNSDILIPVGNPSKLKVKTNFFKCNECGKELFRPHESMKVAKIVDEVNDKLDSGQQVETLELDEGKLVN